MADQTPDPNKSKPSTSAQPPSEKPATNTVFVLPTAKHAQSKKGETTATKVVYVKRVNQVTSKDQLDQVIKDAGDKIVIIEFFAKWCCPCKALEAKLEEWADQYRDLLVIVRIDVEDMEEFALDNDISNLPEFLVLKNNKKIDKFSGSKVEFIEAAIERQVGKSKEQK